jgi:toxin ParE1/3/4
MCLPALAIVLAAVPDRLLEATEALRTLPDGGSCPNELRSLGISEYRQVFFKPHRLIYRVHAQLVVIYVVADGGRVQVTPPG